MHVTKPAWLKIKLAQGEHFQAVRKIVKKNNLHTVCEEALCPNISECWGKGTATFMILGDICTRSCGFCAIKTGKPIIYDEDEPQRVAWAVKTMKLRHAVITSVNRDELPDGGAVLWARTVKEIRKINTNCFIEVLIPDFKGDWNALQTVLDSKPDILAHNLETVPNLYRKVRPQASYEQSLEVLSRAKSYGAVTKTGIMVGLGETFDEAVGVMKDTTKIEVDIFTLGQYLQPTKENLPVERYIEPKEFEEYRRLGISWGFKYIESGPLVRSSYHADLIHFL